MKSKYKKFNGLKSGHNKEFNPNTVLKIGAGLLALTTATALTKKIVE